MSGTEPEPNVLRGPMTPQPNVLRGPSSPTEATPEPAVPVEPPLATPWEIPPKKGSAWRGWVIPIGVIAVIAIAGLIFRDRLTGAATDLRVGDCFDEPAEMNEITDVQHRPCNEQHDGEVIFVGDHPDQAEYPGLPALDQFAEDRCVPAFESYVGRDYQTDRELELGLFYPLEEAWDGNDREIACWVYRVDEQPLTNSVKVAGS
ncbi:MAG TPA: septum formation family protein [Candidatus Eisenbacteria bacterium]|nr:septum formation family protein [Candidatus Eisenbacteria bacterium]